MTSFSRLLRFEATDGQVYFAEQPGCDYATDLAGLEVAVYNGDPLEHCVEISSEKKTIGQVLCPIPAARHIYGIGLNYRAHAAEANLPIPEFPMVFSKPPDALAGPYEDIPVHKECTLMDYEGELAVVIGKDCKDIPDDEDPLAYVLGYCVGNDVSSRYWQMPERAGQAGYAKGFDKFAPLGPVLVSPMTLRDIGSLRLTTKVNGQERQSTLLSDMIFDVQTLIRHLSRAMTLRRYTVILTGTPSGVAALMKPPQWLVDGDEVEIEIEKIGIIRNKMKFSSS